MAYLNWKQEPLRVTVSTHARLQMQLHLELTTSQIQLLATELRDVYSQNSELRVDLPQNWTAFFKRTDGEGRLLAAHPQQDEWVGSFILDDNHAREFLARLQALATQAGAPVELSTLGTCNFTSNLELMISKTC